MVAYWYSGTAGTVGYSNMPNTIGIHTLYRYTTQIALAAYPVKWLDTEEFSSNIPLLYFNGIVA